jgi:DNA polymerase III epsilon subunit-like protein
MALSLQHLNGGQFCAIDIETSGNIPGWHEILQIAILPLDSHLEVRKDVIPFTIYMIPESPERAQPEALKVNKLKLEHMQKQGIDQFDAIDLFERWKEKLKLSWNKYGSAQSKIVPLGHNYHFDQAFIRHWMGEETYNHHFSWEYRDTKRTAMYLNDRAAFHGETVPFSKTQLTYLARCLKVEHSHGHDALQDCVMTAKVYKKMCHMGLF